MMRRRSRLRRILESQCEQDQFLDQTTSSKSSSEDCSDCSSGKEPDQDFVTKSEAKFFCQVLDRLSKELACARGLNDLEEIIGLAAKFMIASAAKETSIASQIAPSKGSCCREDRDCVLDSKADR